MINRTNPTEIEGGDRRIIAVTTFYCHDDEIGAIPTLGLWHSDRSYDDCGTPLSQAMQSYQPIENFPGKIEFSTKLNPYFSDMLGLSPNTPDYIPDMQEHTVFRQDEAGSLEVCMFISVADGKEFERWKDEYADRKIGSDYSEYQKRKEFFESVANPAVRAVISKMEKVGQVDVSSDGKRTLHSESISWQLTEDDQVKIIDQTTEKQITPGNLTQSYLDTIKKFVVAAQQKGYLESQSQSQSQSVDQLKQVQLVGKTQSI